MKKTRLILLATLMIFSSLAFAQEKVDIKPKVSGFAQVRYDANFSNDFDLKSNTFFLQRVCVNFDGKFTEKLSYRVGGDFVRRPALTDAFLKYTICDAFVIQAGQMKTPLSIENQFNPAFDCELFDYSTIIKQLTGYEGGVTGIGALGRDIGIMASGSLIKMESKKGEKFGFIEYKVGVFNGNGINIKDNNNRKDLIGRIDIHPGVKALTLSGSYQNGKYFCDSTMNGVNNRWSAGIQFKNERIVVRSEYISAKTGRLDYVSNNNKPFNSTGFYATAGVWINLGKENTQKIMPVVRYERYDSDNTIHNNTVTYYTAGIYYLPMKQVNFKLNYQYVDPDGTKSMHNIIAILNYRF